MSSIGLLVTRDNHSQNNKSSLPSLMDRFDQYMEDDPKATRLIEVSGLQWHNIRRWYARNTRPTGSVWLKLAHSLYHMGYPCVELASIEPSVRIYGKYIAFGLLSIADAEKFLDFTHESGAIYRILLGRQHLTGSKCTDTATERLELIRMYVDDPENKKRLDDWDANNAATFSQPREYKRQHTLHTPHTNGSINLHHQEILQALAGLVKAMRPLAELVESNEFTAEERTKLREMSGQYGIFELKNVLTRLCGERARENLK